LGDVNSRAFSCLRCSKCCFFSDRKECPIVLPHEARYIALLAEHMGIPEPRFERLPAGFYVWIVSGYCPFYDEASKACRIHGEKPLACRMFPLLVNPSTLELSVSSACEWIRRNIDELADLGESVEKVFPSEFSAVKELVTVLYKSAEGGLVSLMLLGDNVKEVFRELASKCTIIKFIESNVVEGLHLMLLSDCSEDYVKSVLHDPGKEVSISHIGKVQVPAKPAEEG